MKAGDLVRARRDKYTRPRPLALVVDISHHPQGTAVRILVDGGAIWVGATMLEVVDEAG